MPFDAIQNRESHFEKQRVLPRRRRRRWFWAIIVLLLIAAFIFVGSRLQAFGEKIFGSQKFSFARLGSLFMSSDKLLIGEEQGEIRILLIGIAGENHDGSNLADTIILTTIKPGKADEEDAEVSLFSIPRDLAVNIPGFDIKKINSAYAYGEAGGQRQGPALAVKTVERFLDTTIPYYAIVDFQGFKKAVDHVGGIDINIETGFTDARFPDNRNGYLPPLTFTAGHEKMDGERALQYVRSRHGNNDQGSDFARARRQQQVLKAFKDRVLNLKNLTNLTLLNNLLSDFADHFRTNLEPTALRRFYNIIKEVRDENIMSETLDGQTGLICDYIAPEDGQYLLVPCAGITDFEAIREYWKNQFISGRLAQENPKIEIQNATKGEALAQRAAAQLISPNPIQTGNFSGDTIYTESIIYDNTGGKKPHTLSYIQDSLGIKTAAGPFPFQNLTPGGADFIIIVTTDIQ